MVSLALTESRNRVIDGTNASDTSNCLVLDVVSHYLTCNFGAITLLALVHLRIHLSRSTSDSASSIPFVVNLYSTLGGISLYLCLSTIRFFSNSLSLLDNVLVLKGNTLLPSDGTQVRIYSVAT